MNSSRRVLACRFGFVMLCILPTVVVGGWILAGTAARFSMAGKAEWERVLTERLGLVAQLDEVRYSRLGVAELVGLRLLDAESQGVVIESGRVEITAKADGWHVVAEQLVVLGDRLDCLARVLGPRILESRYAALKVKGAATVSIAPSDVLLKSKQGEQTLERFGVGIQFSAERTDLEVSWQMPGAASDSGSIHLIATRDRSAATPVTKYRLDTGNQSAPCRLAAAIMPELASLGRECQLRGALELICTAGNYGGQLTGTLTQVDLDSLFTERFGHQLSGLATVRIEQSQIERGKLTQLRGTMQASDGAISLSLVLAAAEHLGLNIADQATGIEADETVVFGQLAMEFQLSGAALRLRGVADSAQERVVLTTASGPVLTSPPKHSVAAVALLRTLLPDGQYQVPATRQTAALVQLLPVPDASLVRRDQAPTHTPTRLMPAAEPTTQAAIRQPVLR